MIVWKKGMKKADAEKAAKGWKELVAEDKHPALTDAAEKNVKAREGLSLDL